MSKVWSDVLIDGQVEYDDVLRAHAEAVERNKPSELLTVTVSIDLEDALEEATVDQLRTALGRELPGYTQEELDAIGDCFSALASGDFRTAEALLPRIFEHRAQIAAAESGLRTLHRQAA